MPKAIWNGEVIAEGERNRGAVWFYPTPRRRPRWSPTASPSGAG
jgi:hypothetical protein